jgi:hypothetical protein
MVPLLRTLLLTALLVGGLAGAAWAVGSASGVQKDPSQNRMLLCQKEYEAKKIPQNGYRDFMKNCIQRKVMPAQ